MTFVPGADVVRFKAEVNFDGREITRCHLNRVDMELLLEVSVSLLHKLTGRCAIDHFTPNDNAKFVVFFTRRRLSKLRRVF